MFHPITTYKPPCINKSKKGCFALNFLLFTKYVAKITIDTKKPIDRQNKSKSKLELKIIAKLPTIPTACFIALSFSIIQRYKSKIDKCKLATLK